MDFGHDAGVAGVSAKAEHERRRQRHRSRDIPTIDETQHPNGNRRGRTGPPSDQTDPQHVEAWAKGAAGEQKLAAYLRAQVGETALLIHDRRVPGTRANIDHIAVTPTGIWVIDAKNYKGTIEHRRVGPIFRKKSRIYVGGRNRTKVAEGMAWQVEAVRRAVGNAAIPFHAAICFVEPEWSAGRKPFRCRDVWVTHAPLLAPMLVAAGPLFRSEMLAIAEQIVAALPEATTSTRRDLT